MLFLTSRRGVPCLLIGDRLPRVWMCFSFNKAPVEGKRVKKERNRKFNKPNSLAGHKQAHCWCIPFLRQQKSILLHAIGALVKSDI